MSLSKMFSAAIGGVWAFAAFGVAAQTPAPETFPVSLDRDVLSAWLSAETDLPASAVVSVKPADLIGIASIQPLDGPASGQFRVQIRAEVISPQIVSQARRRSWAAEVDVDCKGSQAKVRQILDYPMRNLKGEAREAGVSAQWISPSPGAHLYNLISAVCDNDYRRPLSQLALPTPAAVSPGLRPTQSADTPIATAVPRPTAAPPPARAAVLLPAPATPPAPAPAKPTSEPKPAAPRGARVQTALQLGASDSEQKSLDLLKAIRRQHAAQTQGLENNVVRVTVSGKIFYRALLSGFGSQSEAQALCKAIQDGGKACLVRPGGGRGAKP